jgi:hypothetical protein
LTERALTEKALTGQAAFRTSNHGRNHGAWTICLHTAGRAAIVIAGFGGVGTKGGLGNSVDSLNQKSSS